MGMVCGRGKRNAKQATNTTRVLFAEQIRSDWSRAKRAEQREQSKESRAKRAEQNTCVAHLTSKLMERTLFSSPSEGISSCASNKMLCTHSKMRGCQVYIYSEGTLTVFPFSSS